MLHGKKKQSNPVVAKIRENKPKNVVTPQQPVNNPIEKKVEDKKPMPDDKKNIAPVHNTAAANAAINTEKQRAEEDGQRFIKALFRGLEAELSEKLESFKGDILEEVDKKIENHENNVKSIRAEESKALKEEIVQHIKESNENLMKEVDKTFEQYSGDISASIEAVGDLETKLSGAKIESKIVFAKEDKKPQPTK